LQKKSWRSNGYEYHVRAVVAVAAAVFKDVAVELLNDLLFLENFRTEFRKFQIEWSSFLDVASVDQLLEDEAEVDRAFEGVLIGVGGMSHQDLVLLVDAGGKAWLWLVNTKKFKSEN
jgi:hypothetical protein